MTITLREFQIEAIDELTTAAAVREKRRLLLQAPTGAGKTVIASRIISNAAAKGFSVLFLAHRRELVKQCVKKLQVFGVETGTIMSGDFWDQSHKIQVASIASLHSWSIRKKSAGLPPADLVIIDECHHLTSSKTWKEVLAAYPNALILGMTATPINRRGKGLGYFFDEMILCPSIAELTRMGFLVPAQYKVPSLPDLRGVKVLAGDYNEKQLEERMDVPKLIGDIVENWARFAPKRQTLVFASGVKHSIHLVEQFQAIGVKAAHIDGYTDAQERDEIVARYQSGEIQVLSNCGVFTEGTDLPETSCIVVARPTKSLLLYIQIIGRGLRTADGKTDCLILDHAGVVYEFGRIDQEWAWQLEYGQGDVREATRKGHVLKREITCVKCKTVYWGRLECPDCGAKPMVQGKEVATYPAYLQALDDIDNPKEDRKSWYLQFLGYAREKNKKDGFAFFKFCEKFPGEKPPYAWKNADPITPGFEVLAYIKSRNIAWARSKANPSNAPAPLPAKSDTWAWKSGIPKQGAVGI